MRLLTLSLCLLFPLASVTLAQEKAAKPADKEKVLRAGAYASVITPPLGLEIVGNFAPRPIASHVHDDLHARCIVLDDGTTRLAFVVVDSVGVQRDTWDEAKAIVTERTGIPAENLMFSATHTHSSVSSQNKAYRSFLISRIADVVSIAIENLEPAEVAWGTGQLPQWVFSRRYLLKDGETIPNPLGGQDRAVMNPSIKLRPILGEPTGPTNPDVYVLSLQSPEGRPIALMTNYWLHYVGGVPREHLSADYFGEFCRVMEEKLGTETLGAPFVAILANGPCGGINNNDYSGKTPAVKREPYEKIRLVAGDLADEVMSVRKGMKYQSWVPLGAAAEELVLEYRRPTPEMIAQAEKNLAKPEGAPVAHALERHYARSVLAGAKREAKTVDATIQAFRIGELGIASAPFELFTLTGLQIKEKSPFPDTFTIELANGSNGYLPTPDQIDLGGYETWFGTNRVEREASEKIREKALELLEKLKGK